MLGSGDLETLRARLLQDPSAIPAILEELRTTNPMLHQLISQNQAAMMEILLGGTRPPAARPSTLFPRPPVTTGPDREAIDRVLRVEIYLTS